MKNINIYAAIVASAAWSAGAYAQSASHELEEVLVTAQKRSESVQDIPISITALGGGDLRERQISSIEQLPSVAAGVQFGSFGGSARISIRGVGFDEINPGSEGRIAYHVDGAYISRPSAQLGTFYDVERVEVLRGPQGTLYGRNATGGTINVITHAPTDEFSGYFDVTMGSHDRIAVQGALSGPLSDSVSARVAVMSNNRSGYGENEYSGNDIDNANQSGARVSLRFDSSETLSIDLAADYYRESDHAHGIHYFGQYTDAPLVGETLGGNSTTKPLNVRHDVEPRNDRETYGVLGKVEWELGAADLTSITSFRHSNFRVETELDLTDLRLTFFPFHEESDQFSQEIRLSGTNGAVNWIVGGYYFNESIFAGDQVTRNGLLTGGPDLEVNGFRVEGDIDTEAYAVFGQVDIELFDGITVILGGRYSDEEIEISDTFQLDFVNPYNPSDPIRPFPFLPTPRSDSTSNDSFTPRIGVTFTPRDDLLIYATVSEGFKSGGYNLGLPFEAFDPEEILSYEGGVKFTSSDQRIRSNFTVFYYDYENLQVSKVINNTVLTENAASAELYGGELELTVLPADGFQLDAQISYVHSEYEDFESLDPGRPELGVLDLSGNQLIQSPEWTVNAGAQYSFDIWPGTLTLRGEVHYVSDNYFTSFNQESVSQEAHEKFNAYLNFVANDDRWTGGLFVRNIGDEVTQTSGLVASGTVGFPVIGGVSAPRTYGFRIARDL